LKEEGHSFPVDWWTLGILTYEMTVGMPPFYNGSGNNDQIYKLIKSKDVFFPNQAKHGFELSADCMDFITRCLDKDQTKRLGCNGSEEVINHKWFADLDKQQLLKR